MEQQDNSLDNIDDGVEIKKGERRLLSCNIVNVRSPFLIYEYVESPRNVEKAFDILFEEVLKIIADEE